MLKTQEKIKLTMQAVELYMLTIRLLQTALSTQDLLTIMLNLQKIMP
jgi:hypothetical protein